MKCSQVESATFDFLSGNLPGPAVEELEAHLQECAACRETMSTAREMWHRLGELPESQPSPALRGRVDAIIEAYRQGLAHAGQNAGRGMGWGGSWLAIWRSWHPAWQWGLQAALLVLAFIVGGVFQPVGFFKTRNSEALTELRSQVGDLRQLVTLTLLQQPSANERLEGVGYSYLVSAQDKKVLAALLQALETDPNVNVRVAAVGALRQYASDSTVRQGMLRTLAKEASPLVQIELIDLMVQWGEKSSIPVLEKMRNNEEVDPTVRRQVEEGLRRLI
jgi:hypothetical protein